MGGRARRGSLVCYLYVKLEMHTHVRGRADPHRAINRGETEPTAS